MVGVALQVIVNGGIDECVQDQALGMRMGPQKIDQPIQQAMKVELHDLYREAPGFDLRNIQNIVDQGTQHDDRMAQQPYQLILLHVQRCRLQEVGCTSDPI